MTQRVCFYLRTAQVNSELHWPYIDNYYLGSDPPLVQQCCRKLLVFLQTPEMDTFSNLLRSRVPSCPKDLVPVFIVVMIRNRTVMVNLVQRQLPALKECLYTM